MQAAFTDNWMQATKNLLYGDAYLPAIEPAGDMRAHAFTAAPGGGSESMQLLYLMSIAAASRSIDLAASYFVPDEVAVSTLVSALHRGVKVRLLLPGAHIDKPIVRRASRADWGRLLAAGAEIHEYQPTMFHCKVMVVDGLWTTFGSTNFDTRSFTINDEINVNVYDAGLAAQLTKVFEADLQHAAQISLEQWKARPLWDRALDYAATLLSSQL